MPRGDYKFIYRRDPKSSSKYPVNPAISNILRLPRNRAWIRGIGLEGQAMFQANARKGRNPNPHRNSAMVRTVTHLTSARADDGKVHNLPDRWAARVEAYAPHALPREFGWVPKSTKPTRKLRQLDEEGEKRRVQRQARKKLLTRKKLGERNLTRVASTLERMHYRPYRGA